MMGVFGSRKSKITLQQMLAARPTRLVDAELVQVAEGKSQLTVPVKPANWARLLLRVPSNVKKTFELDPLGVLVWESSDGKTSVQQIIRKLSKRYDLNVREAQVATIAFLNTLTRKGLVGMQLRERRGGQGGEANQ